MQNSSNKTKFNIKDPSDSSGAFGLFGSRQSFTLVELMIVIAILAILSAIVIFTLNPARLFDNFRDTKRVTDITSIHRAINFMETWNTSMSYGTSTNVYISLPDASPTCSAYTLPTLPAGYSYACSSLANHQKTDGTGWIPINFTVSDSNRYLSNLPVDPVNNITFFYTYYPGGSYEVSALLKNPNTNSINDDDAMTGAYTLGSPNRSWTSPLSRDTNLVGHWKFDEGSGTTAHDSSGYGNHGNMNSGVTRYFLESGHEVVHFNGSGRVSTSSFSIFNSGVLSFLFWTESTFNKEKRQTFANWGSQSTNNPFIWIHRSENTNNIAYRGAGGGQIFINDFFKNLDNEWVHVAIIYNYNKKTWYVFRNGSLVQSLEKHSDDPLFPHQDNIKFFGSYQVSSAHAISDGYLGEFRIYNRALSPEEISQIYNQTKHKYQ